MDHDSTSLGPDDVDPKEYLVKHFWAFELKNGLEALGYTEVQVVPDGLDRYRVTMRANNAPVITVDVERQLAEIVETATSKKWNVECGVAVATDARIAAAIKVAQSHASA
jgi:hypothetical protein